MRRRELLGLLSGAALVLPLVSRARHARADSFSYRAIEERLGSLVQTYDSQGNHRTATPADNASAEWLALEARRAGVEPSLEPFTLSRVDPVYCY